MTVSGRTCRVAARRSVGRARGSANAQRCRRAAVRAAAAVAVERSYVRAIPSGSRCRRSRVVHAFRQTDTRDARPPQVMVKPDGVQRGLVGEIVSRFERKGFTVTGLKLFRAPRSLAEEHYKDLSSKPFFNDLVEYIISGPVVCMVLEGKGVVASARKLIGATNPLESEPGTIRGDFAVEVGRNIVHGSDSVENGEREIALWFGDGGIEDWTPTMTPWLRELDRAD